MQPPLQKLARAHFDSNQGLLVRSEDGTVLAALNTSQPFHPASVTKVASTLAFLREWGPDHRLRTTMGSSGTIENGTLAGDLVIRSGGDPYFVFENAFLMLIELHRMGLRRIQGKVRVRGTVFFNWTEDRQGEELQQALAGRAGLGRWQALQAHRAAAANVRLADIAVSFGAAAGSGEPHEKTLVTHDSAPLRRLLKEFNGYSNNIFHSFSRQVGGPRAIQRVARTAVPDRLRGHIAIDNAAGGGRTNRLSPAAAVAIFEALDRELAAHSLSLSDVLPVAGVDGGTLEHRLHTPALRGAVVGKTGTLPSIAVSALAGVAYTRRYGRVFFAIFNRGVPIWQARKKQDAFLAALLEHADAAPLDYLPAARPAFTEALVE